MLRKITIFISLILLTLSCAWAIDNPVTMLNNSMVATQNNIVKNSEKYQQDPYALLALVQKNVLPVVNTQVIAQLIVGAPKWKAATPKVREEFIESATQMITFMYAKNIASAGKYQVTLIPFNPRDDSWKSKKLVTVNGKITNIDSQQNSDLSIKLFKKNNKWFAYDFNVAGVSILKTYQQQFVPYKTVSEMVIAANKVTDRIKKKNYPKLLNNNLSKTDTTVLATK